MGKPRHLDDVDNLESELQLRNVTRAPVVAHNGRVNDLGKPVRPHNKEIGHRVNEQENLYGFLNNQYHGDHPLRQDRDVDDLWNSHDLHNVGINHLAHVQLGNSRWSDEQSGPWDKPLRHDKENLHELHAVSSTTVSTRNFRNSMVATTMGIDICTTRRKCRRP